MKGLSTRNLSRIRTFYKEYHDLSILPVPLAKLPWTHNYTLVEKIKDRDKRLWYAEKCLENGWSQTVLIHQIESNLYQRQIIDNYLKEHKEYKLTNYYIDDGYSGTNFDRPEFQRMLEDM